MAKEWFLNSATNRFQLNFKRNVVPTSLHIRTCQPNSLKEWEDYYFSNVKSREHLKVLGEKLFIKITEVLVSEINEITKQDCIDYIFNLVINRTYDGYDTEIKTVYGQLQSKLNEKIEVAPDKWDRLFNVDFYIKVNDNYIGLQIKPVNDSNQITQIYKEINLQANTHKKFTEKFGGKVFYIFSISDNKKKIIQNPKIIDDILIEINNLKN